MSDIAIKLKLVKDRDEMRKLSLDEQKQLQIKTAEQVGKMKNVIVDTHCTIKTPKGYMPGLPEWVLKELNPTAIVIVEADPQEIFNRRAKDTTRNRDPDSVEKIAEHQMMNRAAAMSYATLTGATVNIVQSGGSPEWAMARLSIAGASLIVRDDEASEMPLRLIPPAQIGCREITPTLDP